MEFGIEYEDGHVYVIPPVSGEDPLEAARQTLELSNALGIFVVNIVARENENEGWVIVE